MSYSPETLNSGENQKCFVPCDLEIWWMTLKNNRAPLLYSLHLLPCLQRSSYRRTHNGGSPAAWQLEGGALEHASRFFRTPDTTSPYYGRRIMIAWQKDSWRGPWGTLQLCSGHLIQTSPYHDCPAEGHWMGPGTLFNCPQDTSVTRTHTPALCWLRGSLGHSTNAARVWRTYLKAENHPQHWAELHGCNDRAMNAKWYMYALYEVHQWYYLCDVI